MDAKPDEPWPYEALMPFLDTNLERGGGIVFVLAGSSGQTIQEFKERIRARPKGTDVLSRVPEANGWEIAPMDAGDRILVALSQMLNAASELDRSLAEVEKLALHYLAAAPHLANARQLREFAVRAVQRGSASSDRIRFDDLFDSGDPENKSYWASVMPQAEVLAGSFVHLRDSKTSATGGSSTRPETPRTHLPVPTTPFFGREPELQELTALLTREDTRLVTLTGPGGSGKTRLALQAAIELVDAFADGAFFVSLAPLRETSAVHSEVAEALGLEADADVPAWLASRRTLLVLDNLEHLKGVEAIVSELLVGETVVLATSRGPLRLSSEHELPVEPLARDAAVELFVSRAEATGRHIAADETVGEICRRLDDLPLALELAAARVRLLSPPALLQRLDESLSLLTTGARDLPERQRTLRATIEWSHDLLSAEEQAAFRRLSVFRGSFSLEAAEAIAGADLDEIATLVEQSLLKPLGDERFFLLETLREYAREWLGESGETDEYALRHARWYLERLEDHHPQMVGLRHGELMAWFASEEDNLRAMLTVLAGASPSRAARGARLLHRYWRSCGAYSEERQRLTELLERDDVPDSSRADVFGLLSDVEFMVGDQVAAELAARESLRLAEPGDVRTYALLTLAAVAGARGDSEEAVRLAREVLLEIDAVDEQLRPMYLVDVGSIFRDAGLREEARTTHMQVSDEARRRDNPLLIDLVDGNACWLDLLEEHYEAAAASSRSSVEAERRLGHARFEADALRGLGVALLGLDRRDEARTAFASALELLAADRTRNLELTATLVWIALATEPANASSAARLAGSVDAVRQKAGLTTWASERELRRRFEQPLIDALGEDEWAREHEAGATLTLEEAIELARTLAAPPPDGTAHSA